MQLRRIADKLPAPCRRAPQIVRECGMRPLRELRGRSSAYLEPSVHGRFCRGIRAVDLDDTLLREARDAAVRVRGASPVDGDFVLRDVEGYDFARSERDLGAARLQH